MLSYIIGQVALALLVGLPPLGFFSVATYLIIEARRATKRPMPRFRIVEDIYGRFSIEGRTDKGWEYLRVHLDSHEEAAAVAQRIANRTIDYIDWVPQTNEFWRTTNER